MNENLNFELLAALCAIVSKRVCIIGAAFSSAAVVVTALAMIFG